MPLRLRRQRERPGFLPGHDQRAIHDRINQIGTVSEFLDWFDIVRRAGAKLEEY